MNPFTNWKTTGAGVGAIAVNLLSFVTPMLKPETAVVLSSIMTGIGLLFAKDQNVTGGTVRQPSSK